MMFNKKKATFCTSCSKPLTKHDKKRLCERCHNQKVSLAKNAGGAILGVLALIPIVRYFTKK